MDGLGSQITFGDTVRVVSTELTQRLGLAGLVGTCYGQTIPSSSGVGDVIGMSDEDYAVNVFFDDRDEAFWFAAHLLEFVDHGPGIEIQLDGIDKKWTRSDSGQWIEKDLPGSQSKSWWQKFKSMFR